MAPLTGLPVPKRRDDEKIIAPGHKITAAGDPMALCLNYLEATKILQPTK
jgi:hypothetical protein